MLSKGLKYHKSCTTWLNFLYKCVRERARACLALKYFSNMLICIFYILFLIVNSYFIPFNTLVITFLREKCVWYNIIFSLISRLEMNVEP